MSQVQVATFTSSLIKEEHNFKKPEPGTKILNAGSLQAEGHRPLLCDILVESHVPITLRDGVVIYANIYRPPNAPLGSVPAIIAAGPFGKDGGPNKVNFDKWPWRFGCPRIETSGLEKFEGPDPGYWCYHGYAIVHTDCRGVWQSEGVIGLPSKQEGRDNYDIIEFLAAQTWSNGKVTMCGNSYLAMTQWYTGAEQPPHLACLAPWEGISDIYRDSVCQGGIINPGFLEGLLRGDIASEVGNQAVDIRLMIEKYPLWNEFWQNHTPEFEKIQCPMYIGSSWTNTLHVSGTFRAWQKCGSTQKWLRVHNSHEWPDLYDEQNVTDLRKFYDYYMKGVNNDWKFTPRVRLSVLNAGGLDTINRPESDFPLQRQEAYKLYLDASSMVLKETRPEESTQVSYEATDGQVQFRFPIPSSSPMEFTGYIKLRLWVEAQGSNDMDIWASLWKYDTKTGKLLESAVVDVGRLATDPEKERAKLIQLHEEDPKFAELYFDSGPMGMLRASHRELDETESTPFNPVHTHRKEQLLEPGQVVPIDIAFWPYGMTCNPGEEIRLTLSGNCLKEHLRPSDPRPELRNSGRHVVHTGGEYDSYLLLPLIPQGV